MAKKVKKEECCEQGEGHCHKCHGMKMLILGVLVLLNTYYMWLSWPYFIGTVLVAKGLLVALMHKCKCGK